MVKTSKKPNMILALLVAVLLVLIPTLTVSGEDELPGEYGDMMDSLPDDATDSLPDEIFSDELGDLVEGAQAVSSWENVIDTVLDILGLNIRRVVRVFAELCAIIALCALLNMLKTTSSNTALSRLLSTLGTGVVALAVMELSREPIDGALRLLDNIELAVNSMSPCLTAMYAMGGNVATATVQHYGLIVFLSILNGVCITALRTVVGICLALSISAAFGSGNDLFHLNRGIRRAFASVIGFLMLLFTTVISAQTLLSTKADTLSTKTAKLLASQMIPLVGGSVGESLRTAGASIEYLRSNVGVILIAALGLMILPTLISLFLYRLCFSLANSAAGALGCEREARLLEDISGIYGYIIAVLCICSVVVLLLITVFAKCGSALG